MMIFKIQAGNFFLLKAPTVRNLLSFNLVCLRAGIFCRRRHLARFAPTIHCLQIELDGAHGQILIIFGVGESTISKCDHSICKNPNKNLRNLSLSKTIYIFFYLATGSWDIGLPLPSITQKKIEKKPKTIFLSKGATPQ